MSIMKSMNECAKKLSILDIKLAQGAAMCLMLIIAKLFPQILRIDIGWFIALALLLAIKPLISFYGKK
ncbi:MAG: hypothetical protein WBB37_02440 [bacterium]